MGKECCGVESSKNGFFSTTKWKLSVLFVGVALCVLSYFWEHISGDAYGVLKFLNPAWLVIFVCGWPLAYGGFKNLFKYGKVRTSLLITVAMIGCIALEILCWCGIGMEGGGHSHNNLFSAGEVAIIMWLGELLEDVTLKKSRKNLESLIKLTPTTARIKMGDQYIEMETEYVAIDDVVLVKPNETITVDGIVVSGATTVSQSAITGESLPVDKKVGDTVYAGTQNGSGAVEITVTKLKDDNTLSKMIKLVKDAESKKSQVERTADKWAKIIVPSAIILSMVVFAVVFFGMQQTWQTALTRGITILVVFCPCSLALATPTAIVAGMGNASARGVLIKSGSALESISKCDVVVFDKTGTLTQNKLSVDSFDCVGIAEEEFLALCGSAEIQSEHPLAKAIVDFCQSKTKLSTPSETTSMVGVGVASVVEGKRVTVAKSDYFKELPTEIEEFLKNKAKDGFTVVCMALEGVVVGAMALSDTLNEGAKPTIQGLKKQGISTVMLTGDNRYVAQTVAQQVGVDEYNANLLPEEKVAKVKEYLDTGKKVCMVGDGVNDAPALATATVGVAMGAMGSDVAMDVADVVLLNDNVKNVTGIVKLGKKVLQTITVNITFGMAVNLLSVVLSIFGLLNPALGALVHNGTSILVVGNSALLIGAKKPFMDEKITTAKSGKLKTKK